MSVAESLRTPERGAPIGPPPATRHAATRAYPEAGVERYRFVLLVALVMLAFVLRVTALDRVPPGLDSDEVSIGYNAYAVLRTGRDEYGARLPLAFRAFGEFKRPAYVYAAVPSIGLFGLTELGVRFPAAAIGALSVVPLYAVAVLLLRKWWLGLLAAALLTVSPWHLQFTRAAREVSLLVFAVLVLAAALLYALHSPRARAGPCYVVAGLALLLALYSYPGGVIFAPLLAVLLVTVYRPRRRDLPLRWVGAAALVAMVGVAPLVAQAVDGRAAARYNATLLFTSRPLVLLSRERMARDEAAGLLWVLNHPWMLGARQAVDAYLSHFDLTYLFTRGDPNWRHHASDHGQLYLWDLPLLAAGIAAVLRERKHPAMQAIAGWLLLGPLPASFAVDAPHAVRSIPMLPAWYLLAAAGAPVLWRWLRQRRLERDWLLLLALSVAFFVYMAYRHYPAEHDEEWSGGAIAAYHIAQAEVAAGRARRIVLPPKPSDAYAYALFATAYDPAHYLAQGGTGQLHARPISREPSPLRFEPFEVREVQWDKETRDGQTVYVMWLDRGRPPEDATIIWQRRTSGGHGMAVFALRGS
ncbi:MAG: glycosyltransferase family 39 protein [Chloroflexi bacterium]|nr:glycosyltransferase family 39 protein [Chloroflexota bacterium]